MRKTGNTRFVYACDVHGSVPHYDAILRMAREETARLVILGGDLFPNEGDLVREQSGFIAGEFRAFLARCKNAGVMVVLIPGNDDVSANDDVLLEAVDASGCAVNVAGGIAEIFGWIFIGNDLVTDYPFLLKDRVRLDTGQEPVTRDAVWSRKNGYTRRIPWGPVAGKTSRLCVELDALPKVKEGRPWMFLCHAPPAGAELDVTYGKNRVGSVDVRAYIEKNAPAVSFHGHIHESPEMSGGTWKARIGDTFCVQPGQDRRAAVLVVGTLGENDFKRRIVPLL
ncbi:MAG: hypothetical protein C4529_00105 [Deltaproteobacteria bacterium]|nr:MAG: hypothetical protein C4529_00105 [Deltaproteobacteria bacterium]